MFPQKQRLTRAAFSPALQGGKRVSSPHFSAIVPRQAEGYAVVVSKKTAKLSVTRHRLKRRVQGALRTLSASLPPSLILYPRASVLEMRYDDLKAELTKLVSSIHS